MIGLAALRCHGEKHGPNAVCVMCGCYASCSVYEASQRAEWCEASRCVCHDSTVPHDTRTQEFRVVCPDGMSASTERYRTLDEALEVARWHDEQHDPAICGPSHRVEACIWEDA